MFLERMMTLVHPLQVDFPHLVEEENKELFVDDLCNNLDDLEDNLFYEDLIDNQNILYDIYDELIKSNEMKDVAKVSLHFNLFFNSILTKLRKSVKLQG